jgi:hypothetical protein
VYINPIVIDLLSRDLGPDTLIEKESVTPTYMVVLVPSAVIIIIIIIIIIIKSGPRRDTTELIVKGS